MANLDDHEEVATFVVQAEKLREKLTTNEWFKMLSAKTQKRCLAGDNLMVCSRDEILAKVNWDKKSFYFFWDLLSQFAHILPISFYRMEPSGTGTGLENDKDKGYIALGLQLSADALTDATDTLVEQFPEIGATRNGIRSTFSPGPKSNSRLRF